MVVYTQKARDGAGGREAMEGLIYGAVAETNQAYANSLLDQRLRLVHVEEVSYTETGFFDSDFNSLVDGTNGLNIVHTLRDTFAADVVSLITETGDSCGVGQTMVGSLNLVGHVFENLAYSVVKRDCATGNFSLAHEIGHNMGAMHATGDGAYADSHAHSNMTPRDPSVGRWRTVMADQTTPASVRIPYFSNPRVNYPAVGGDPTGVAGSSNNARTLNSTKSIVSNFRCSSSGASNVWMKDTWNDTGLEPDARTATEDMWKSPYIWVRTAQDGLIHQHEHQNPVFGAQNWVYVKLQNGGATPANGNLEVYGASASTSLTWQRDWTLLSSTSVSALPAHSTKVIEVPWNNLPGTGHFCLVARWNSPTDPMATQEGGDINANVRANNNLVWRNLHIVDLMLGANAEAMVNVMNPDDGNEAITIAVRSPSDRAKASFLASGQVLVELDDTLRKAWKDGGARGTGFRTDGDGLIIGEGEATLENVLLPFQRVGRMKLIFRRLPGTPKREYLVDVEQRRSATFATAHKLSAVVGGVSYEIHTDRDHLRR